MAFSLWWILSPDTAIGLWPFPLDDLWIGVTSFAAGLFLVKGREIAVPVGIAAGIHYHRYMVTFHLYKEERSWDQQRFKANFGG